MMMMDEVVFHRNYETVFYIVMIAMTGCVAMYMMRSDKDHGFVNALPVTKKQQWGCMYMALLTVVFIVYTLYILIVTVAFKNDVNTMPEIIISGVVKAVSAVLVMNFMLWLFGHTDFRFSVKAAICFVLIILGLPAMGSLIQKAFNTGGNNFVYELKTYWCLMTVPKKAFVEMAEEQYSHRCINLVNDKTMVVVIYLAVAIVLAVILAVLAWKNYSRMDFSKNPKKGNIKEFSPVLVVICIALSTMGICSWSMKAFDKFRLESSGSLFEINYDGPLLDEYFMNDDTEMIVAYKNSEVYYYGIVAKNYDENCMQKYEIYMVDFPKDYLFFFMGSAVVSVVVGTTVMLMGKKTKERRM